MRLTLLVFASLPLLAACGPDPGGTTDTATTTVTATAGTTGATTGSATGTATTDATTPSTATTDAPTSTTAATDTPTTDTATDPGTTTAATTTSSTDATTGQSTDTGAGALCDDDADCKLNDDCCVCDGVPVDVDGDVCDEVCDQSKCSELGIAAAVCRFGVCTTTRLSCDASKVACDAAPPPCRPGTVAETTPACWTGRCVPAKYCDVVETCEQCPADRVCVQNLAFAPEPGVVCEPLTPGCDPATPCACIGDQVCLDPFTFCVDQPGGDITCECINC